MQTTMKAFVPSQAAEARTELAEVDVPVPEPGQALIEVEAYSVNRGETFLLEHPRPAWRPGQDVAGRIVQAAADGSGPGVGSRVVAHAEAGGWAPLVAVSTDAVASLPDELGAVTAATLPLAGLTGLRLIRESGPLVGRRLLVTGASGGVGHIVTELAVGAGAEVVAVAGSAQRGQRLREFGALVISSLDEVDGSFDVILESVGGDVLAQAITRLAPRGLLLWFGQAGRQPATLDFFRAAGGAPNGRIGLFVYFHGAPAAGEDLATLVRLVVTGRLHPEVGRVDDWRQTQDALLAVRDRRVRGNAVLVVPPEDRVRAG